MEPDSTQPTQLAGLAAGMGARFGLEMSGAQDTETATVRDGLDDAG